MHEPGKMRCRTRRRATPVMKAIQYSHPFICMTHVHCVPFTRLCLLDKNRGTVGLFSGTVGQLVDTATQALVF